MALVVALGANIDVPAPVPPLVDALAAAREALDGFLDRGEGMRERGHRRGGELGAAG